MEEHKTNDPMHMEPLMELPSPLEDKDAVHLHAISVRLFLTPTEVEAILPTMDPMDLPEAMVDLVEVLEEDPEEVTEDLAEVPEEDPVDPPMEEAMGDTPMAEPEARMEVVAVELETHMEVVVADLETLMEVTVEETMILTDTTSDSMMAASLGELKSSPSRSPRP